MYSKNISREYENNNRTRIVTVNGDSVYGLMKLKIEARYRDGYLDAGNSGGEITCSFDKMEYILKDFKIVRKGYKYLNRSTQRFE